MIYWLFEKIRNHHWWNFLCILWREMRNNQSQKNIKNVHLYLCIPMIHFLPCNSNFIFCRKILWCPKTQHRKIPLLKGRKWDCFPLLILCQDPCWKYLKVNTSRRSLYFEWVHQLESLGAKAPKFTRTIGAKAHELFSK